VRQPSPVPFDGVDPRVTRSRAAVIRAATDLLVEGGPSAVTIDAIVARSGVAKSTIYRHWESRDDVLVAVIEHCAPEIAPPDPDADVETALRQTMRQMVVMLNDPEWARVIPALLLLKNHEAGIADLDERLEKERDAVLAGILERGAKEGVLRPELDTYEAMTALMGPLLFAHLTDMVKVDDALADRTVDNFLAAYGTS
jgi:TetR/AcrR family transcriptional regulator, regulator of autoinduction and epiphytic fitness